MHYCADKATIVEPWRTVKNYTSLSATPMNAPRELQGALARDPVARSPLLVSLGERVRTLRAQRGMTRRAVAIAAEVSERHLANLEHGTGNPSILVLQQVAGALQCSLAALIGDVTTSSPEWLLVRELLDGRDENELRRARLALGELFDERAVAGRNRRIALIGLRGAGKSTLGGMLAGEL